MIKIINGVKECFFFHRWETIRDNGFTKYQKCKDCNSKRILQQEGVYQPIDRGWLTKTNNGSNIMIKTVNGVKIGDTFVFEGDDFEITGFRSRCTVFGKIKKYKPGGPDTCKVSIKDVNMKSKGILTEESYRTSK